MGPDGARPRKSSKLPPFTVGGWLAVAEVRLEEVAVLRRHEILSGEAPGGARQAIGSRSSSLRPQSSERIR
jgi:hypothetical protein